MKKIITTALMLTTTLLLVAPAGATLIDRGGGMIYDDDTNLTWLQDANTNGAMAWQDAVDWAAGLSFGGFDDWRLPICTESGFDCINNEMEHLFLVESVTTSSQVPFINILSGFYWTGTLMSSQTSGAWIFEFGGGNAGGDRPLSTLNNGWAVRTGDVPDTLNVPEPTSLALMSLGLFGLGFNRRRVQG